MERYCVTPQGLQALRDRLRTLREIERPRNVADIEEARGHGDLSENAEYHAAKERQGLLDVEMRDLKDRIGRAQVIDPATIEEERVVFGATVVLLNLDTDEEVTYRIVGEHESDLRQGSISYKSPLAKALIGHEEGDEVLLQAPGGARKYEIISVSYV